MWQDMLSHAETCLDLSDHPVVGRGQIVRLKIVQNERSIDF